MWEDICSVVFRIECSCLLLGLKSPEGLSIDWVSRNMYWTDSELDCIEVSRLNGTSRKRLFERELINPRAIVVSPQRG